MNKDYLKIPYTVPEGYFEDFKANMAEKAMRQGGNRLWTMVAPYASVAAAFIFIVTAGTFLLKKTTVPEGMTYEDYIVHSDFQISTEYDQESTSTAQMENEDIVNYLIFSGITAEALELTE